MRPIIGQIDSYIMESFPNHSSQAQCRRECAADATLIIHRISGEAPISCSIYVSLGHMSIHHYNEVDLM